MRNLSFIEFLALVFTALAGVAASIQAYVSWQTRDEVARAIIFSERIDACADMLASIEFLADKADEDGRQAVQDSPPDHVYYTEHFLGYDAVRGDTAAVFRPVEARFQAAAAAFKIVMPDDMTPTVEFFERVVQNDVLLGGRQDDGPFLEYLTEVDRQARMILDACRSLG